MRKVSLILFIFLLYLVSVCFSTNHEDPIAKALKTLEDEEREDFLSYVYGISLLDWAKSRLRPPKFFPSLNENIFIGMLHLPKEKIQKFQEIDIPSESRRKLLEWTESEFNLTTRNLLELIRTKRCQGPHCITIGDIGPLCCPW